MLTHTLKEDAHTRRKNVVNPERYNFLFRMMFFSASQKIKLASTVASPPENTNAALQKSSRILTNQGFSGV